MHIRTFRAANLNAALALIRQQMGPQASILHTRKVSGGLGRLFGFSQVEVTAGLKHAAFDERERRPESVRCLGPLQLSQAGTLRVALVGATGVGKTTTIAKLAAGFKLSGDVVVGLLTLDRFRAAAEQQLQAYADAMRVELVSLHSLAETDAALSKLDHCDVVFIDTTGHSPTRAEEIQRTTAYLNALSVDVRALVIDCNSSRASIEAQMTAFAALQPNGLILSKADEVPYPSELMKLLSQQGQGIRYVTTGQNVPHDIVAADHGWMEKWSSGLAFEGRSSVISSTSRQPALTPYGQALAGA